MSEIPREILLKLLDVFSVEAGEHIEHITRNLLELEKGPSEDQRGTLIEEIFREAHSLKGSAGTLGLNDIERVAHAAEDVFGACKNRQIELSPELVDTVLSALDALTAMLARARTDQQTPEEEIQALVDQIEAPLKGGSPAKPVARLATPAEATTVLANPAPEDPPRAREERAPVDPMQVDPAAMPRSEPSTPKPTEDTARAATPARGGPTERTIRVSMQKLDSFMRQTEEILLAKIRVDQRLAEVRLLSESLQVALREWDKIKDVYRRASKDWTGGDSLSVAQYVRHSADQVKSLSSRVNLLGRNLVNDSQQMQLMSQSIQDDLKGLRLMPVGTIFEPFHRMVRDLAKRLEKKVDFQVAGADIELDKRIIEEIKDPLVHLLRNCVDHGIEIPQERTHSGKSDVGNVLLSAEQRGNRLLVQIKDDGRGIDPGRLRRVAVSRGLMSSAEASALGDDDARRLIFQPGFSTSDLVTDISGRGVGLDVVKQNVGHLGGLVEIESQVGRGTTFSLSVPLSLATAQGLLVGICSETFALPINSIERILRIVPGEVATVRGKTALRVDGRLIPFVSLAEILGIPSQGLITDEQGMFSVVVVGAVEKRVALAVDAVIEEQEIVTKPLGKPLVRVRNVIGATILGDGSVVVLLNPNDLVRTAFGESIKAPALHLDREAATILVADDTITTRTLQKSVLEMAGFRVLTAKDGEEAYSMLGKEVVQVLVTDVQMPRLDGFDLTARVRADPRLKNLPVILVTSLGSEADKARGIEVGADAYIVKKDYDKGKILEVIRQLL